jgi:tetratricopeptide (TPR) repeat protein
MTSAASRAAPPIVDSEALLGLVSPLLHQRLAEGTAVHLPECRPVEVAAALVDVSGFSALAERLSDAGPAGIERLARVINQCFGTVVEQIQRYGGDAHTFPGDAVVAVWIARDGDLAGAARRALGCALEVSAHPNVGGEALSLKVGVGAGDAVVAHLGVPDGRRELLLSGPALDQMGSAEVRASAGDVIVAPPAWELVGGRAQGRPVGEGFVAATAVADAMPTELERPGPPPKTLDARCIELARSYLPVGLLRQLDAGQLAWLGEFRDLAVLFIRLVGVEAVPSGQIDVACVDDAFCVVQRHLEEHEGSIMRIGHDDKGLHVLAAMGLPHQTHENDAERAVRAAEAIAADLAGTCAIGVAAGRLYCGPLGGRFRREYSVIGTAANRAARLAMASQAEVLCDSTTAGIAAGRLAFSGPVEVRPPRGGRPLQVYRLRARAGSATDAALKEPSAGETVAGLVGRRRQQEQIGAWLEEAMTSGPRALVIRGEPGVGKSRLLSVLRQIATSGAQVLSGYCDPIRPLSAYHPWRAVMTSLFASDTAAELADRLQDVRARLERVMGDDSLGSLLAPILGIDFPESTITRGMTGAVRRDNTLRLLVRLLADGRRIGAEALPLIVLLEDAHWMDSASWAVIDTALRQLENVRFAIALTARPEGAATSAAAAAVLAEPRTIVLDLDGLSLDATEELVCQHLGAERVTPALSRRVHLATRGNPLFCGEYIRALHDAGALEVANGVVVDCPGTREEHLVPTSIRAVLATRLDRLSSPAQLTLKLASVAGQRMSRALVLACHPQRRSAAAIEDELDELARAGLIDRRDAGDYFEFRHALIRDVAYESMLFAQRRDLHHVVAEHLEGEGSDDGTLLHHWRAAGAVRRALPYVDAAGRDAMRHASYHEAIELFGYGIDAVTADSDAATIMGARTTAFWRAQVGEAQVALGQHVDAREHLARALRELGHPVRRSSVGLATAVAGQLGRQVFHRLRAARKNHQASQVLLAAAGAYEQLGYIYYSSGEVIAATHAAVTMLNLAERVAPSPLLARSYAGLSLAASVAGPRVLAETYERRALAVAEALQDPATEGHVLWVAALRAGGEARWDRVEAAAGRALALAERVGDGRLCVMALSTRAGGAVMRGDLDAALRHGHLGLETAFARGNRLWEAWSLGSVVEAALLRGDLAPAIAHAERALAIYSEEADLAEELRVSGLLALAALRTGDGDRARQLARATLQRSRETSMTAFLSYSGIAEATEVVLALAEAETPAATVADPATRRELRTACRALARFARVFPVGRPRHALARARSLSLVGRRRQARMAFRRAAILAETHGMPLEQLRVAEAMSRHAERLGEGAGRS